jgi:beta-lactamase regulating signal transducer with metallopeptidase domain
MISKLETILILALVSLLWLVGLVIFSLYWIAILCYITFSESVTRIRKWLKI